MKKIINKMFRFFFAKKRKLETSDLFDINELQKELHRLLTNQFEMGKFKKQIESKQ